MNVDILKCMFAGFYFLLLGHTGNAQTENCYVYNEDIEVLSKDFPEFHEIIDSFYCNSNSYDFLHLHIAGGNNKDCFATRIYKKDDKSTWVLMTKINHVKSIKNIENLGTASVDSAFHEMQRGKFMCLCSYNSLNNTNIYMVKEDGDLIFKLVSEPYSIIELQQEMKLYDFLSFYKKIKMIFVPLGAYL